MTLRLLLDSADPKDWERWMPTGLFTGITTNPTLLARAGQPCELDNLARLSSQALALGAQELHLQAWGPTASDLQHCGTQLAAFAQGPILVKLPVHAAGIQAAQALIAERIPITFTACYDVAQVLIAAALGARYIAPYLGRINDQGRDGTAELVAMQRCLDGIGSSVRLLVASLRQPSDLTQLAAEGISTFTLSPALAEALLTSPATEAAAAQFELDAQIRCQAKS